VQATEFIKLLKDRIDNNTFDLILSDDAGGRVLSLLVRDVYKQVHPGKSLQILFIGAGRSRELWQKLEPIFDSISLESHKVLVVSQFVRTGSTANIFAEQLAAAGVSFEVAALNAGLLDELDDDIFERGVNFIAPQARIISVLDEGHEMYSGVKSLRGKARQIFPSRIDKAVMVEGRSVSTKKYDELAGITLYDNQQEKIEKIVSQETVQRVDEYQETPLTDDEITSIQSDINAARADIKLMSQRIYKTVWDDREES